MVTTVLLGLFSSLSALFLALGIAATVLRRRHTANVYWALTSGSLLTVSVLSDAPAYLFLLVGGLLVLAVFRLEVSSR